MSQKVCEGKQMSDEGSVESMQCLVREIADAEPAGNAKGAIAHAARAIGIGFRRAFGFYYGTARSVSASEWIAADKAAMAARRSRAARLRAELAALEEILGERHGDFVPPQREGAGLDGRSSLGCG
ncbi:hypothetical protein [Teichococcus aestuarii]|uniref:hypothetical protein n=1 Tax=Teichococcus aestuarii TaxID=568898 RepID=UPI00360DD61B